jgi:perosamine synthetase
LVNDYIPVNTPLITKEDTDYVTKAVSEGWISGEGKYVAEFEEAMGLLCKRKHAIAVSNGSVAIDLAIEALGIGGGDEVILPSFTIISCLAQILRNGATPVFVDALPDTWNMDVSQVESLISPKTKAIMAVHTYGIPVDMDPLIDMASRHGIPIIEDAAEAHGIEYKNRVAGSMGLVSTFSFYANKNITTGEGGMVLTDDGALASKIRTLRNLAFMPEKRFFHEELGWNSRISSIQAALGTSQIKRISSINKRRREIGQTYQEAFSALKNAGLPVSKTDYAENNYWVFGLTINADFDLTAAQIMRKLEERGIGARPFFHPLHDQPVLLKYFGGKSKQDLPVSSYLGAKGFYIPNSLGLRADELDRIVDTVYQVLG